MMILPYACYVGKDLRGYMVSAHIGYPHTPTPTRLIKKSSISITNCEPRHVR